MFRSLLSALAALLLALPAAAQTDADWNKAVPLDILILRSTRSYAAALQTARQAATRLHVPLDLGGNQPHPTAGLTISRADCKADGYDYPSYLARGNGAAEDSRYVSVEYSTAYEGFAKGYYIVVAAVGRPGTATVRQARTAPRLPTPMPTPSAPACGSAACTKPLALPLPATQSLPSAWPALPPIPSSRSPTTCR